MGLNFPLVSSKHVTIDLDDLEPLNVKSALRKLFLGFAENCRDINTNLMTFPSRDRLAIFVEN